MVLNFQELKEQQLSEVNGGGARGLAWADAVSGKHRGMYHDFYSGFFDGLFH
ncbi:MULTISPECIES: class IIb bacteriocin, lactobin A/cerein 7B family [Fructobacillus]|uniref:Uncharacterized protein n=1 Tax=Fructobacillus tropaeoli TaxID=709323 RepID=A0ABN9Z3T2_9LACO|nr:unnamed protein product [Fructobacillus sp. LMG 32999]CAK1254608.1 unnamed protein product [Fructobacillus tropaeoli]